MTKEAQYGKQIRDIRKSKGLTQAQLAERAGIAANTLSRYEINERQPTIEILTKLANALEMTVGELLWSQVFETSKQTLDDFSKNPDKWKKATPEDLERMSMTSEELLLHHYSTLNTTGKEKAVERVEELTQIERYTSPDDVENK